tara:strand:+ start:1471 stop:1611 length:141 start_codon:yes stop_codon:yes gene_type:complete
MQTEKSDPVDKYKQTYPNHIDKMPVPSTSFKSEMIFMREVALNTAR